MIVKSQGGDSTGVKIEQGDKAIYIEIDGERLKNHRPVQVVKVVGSA